MGHGAYSTTDRMVRSASMGYDTKTASEIFVNKAVSNKMSPKNVDIRESRDGDEHPESVAIVLALDVTGSMGAIPHYLVKKGLPNIMSKCMQLGIAHPQMLFLGIGDHECDEAPLQVGQFESSDELLDKWLTDIWLEGGGGGNNGESYLLAWAFAGLKTSIDCFEKRGQKGFLFTIGDEPTLKEIPSDALLGIFGNGQYTDMTAVELLALARKQYHVYHLHMKQGHNGLREDVMGSWKQLMGDALIIVNNQEEVTKIIPEIIAKNTKQRETITISTDDIGSIEEML